MKLRVAQHQVEISPRATPFALSTSGQMRLGVSDVRVASATVPQDRCAF
jgi:hypothetical protein